MLIAFRSNQLCERGTEVALYDYADYNETILGNESIIISQEWRNNPENLVALDKFKDRFKVFLYPNGDNGRLNDILRDTKTDALYNIKHGANDGVLGHGVKNLIHCVFDMSDPHGDVYAGVSKTLCRKFGRSEDKCVPHIIRPCMVNPCHVPMDSIWRESMSANGLDFPDNVVFIGRYGGCTEFDVPFAAKIVEKIIKENSNIYFLFMNTNKFCDDHPQIIHFEMETDIKSKQYFIQCCDAMLHARMAGETFGLSVGEFSIMNKPIITYAYGRDRAHLDILGDAALIYHDEDDLEALILDIKDIKESRKNWDMYSKDYNPEAVMRQFNEVFLK